MNTIGFLDSVWRDLRYGCAPAPAQPRLRARRDSVAGARRRREHGDLPAARRGAPAHAAGRRNPQQLVEIRIADTTGGRTGQFTGRRPILTNPLWERIRDRQQAFSSAFAWSSADVQPDRPAAKRATRRASG